MALGIEHNLVLVHRLIKALTLGAWMPSFIYMITPEPKKSGYLKQLFVCPVLFDGEYNGIEFHASDLTKALPSAGRQLSAILHGFVDQKNVAQRRDLVDEVSVLIEKNLLAGGCSVDAVVRFLPLARSTLQHKLAELGTSYQQLLDSVRERRALDALSESDISIGQLSDALGDANIDAFSRAFKKRFGCSPRTWRKRQRSSSRTSDRT